MKLSPDISMKARSRQIAKAGFTLGEMMIAVAVFSLVIAAMVSVQIFGLRVYTLAATKLTATQGGRETMNLIRDQIRSSQQVYVGSFTNSIFTQVPNGSNQIGNALQITTSTNSSFGNNYVVYYQNSISNSLFSYNPVGPVVNDLADYVTNNLCFQAEDYQQNILTNYQNNPVIRITLQFYQWEYPVGFVGSNAVNAYDYYYLRSRVARRVKSLN
jgi:prepilin-type N-terminal cleavage/methylation domain-containing protein